MTISLELELPEKIGWNQLLSSHWRKRHRITKLYQHSLMPQILQQIDSSVRTKIEEYDDFPIETAYVFKWRVRPLDWTNNPVKLVEDCLVKAGIFPDDAPKYIVGGPVYSERGPKGQKGDWVTVTFTL